MIFNVEHTANWEYIRAHKQRLIKNNNTNKNKSCIPHTYHVHEKVMLCKGTEYKYETPFSGPHEILQVNMNGTVHLQVGSVTDMINIRRIQPYVETPDSIHGGECNM
jgi:hypothetical protein